MTQRVYEFSLILYCTESEQLYLLQGRPIAVLIAIKNRGFGLIVDFLA
jgi:hypothetical protein